VVCIGLACSQEPFWMLTGLIHSGPVILVQLHLLCVSLGHTRTWRPPTRELQSPPFTSEAVLLWPGAHVFKQL